MTGQATPSLRLASTDDSRIADLHPVVAGILIDDGKVFLCHRSATRRWYPSLWDLPGGHIEETETPAAAFVRELHEDSAVLILGAGDQHGQQKTAS